MKTATFVRHMWFYKAAINCPHCQKEILCSENSDLNRKGKGFCEDCDKIFLLPDISYLDARSDPAERRYVNTSKELCTICGHGLDKGAHTFYDNKGYHMECVRKFVKFFRDY